MSTCKAVFSALACFALLILFVLAGTAGAADSRAQVSDLPQKVLDGGSSLLPDDLLNEPPPDNRLQPLQKLVSDPASLPLLPPAAKPSTRSDPDASSPAPAAHVAPQPRVRAAPPRLKADNDHRGRMSGGSSGGPRSRARPAAQPRGRDGHKNSSLNVGAFRALEPGAEGVADDTAAPHRSLVVRVIDRVPPQYRAALIALACLSTFFALTTLRERRRSSRVGRQAMVDSLTHLPNRQAFERRLAKEWQRSDRYGRPLGLLLLDLDDFKEINDTQGHAAGDTVLRDVAATLSGRVRVTDMAARLGGDEFVVICPETTLAGLKSLASSLEDRFHEAAIRTSVGFAEREATDESPSEMVARADAAMYRRKQSTRERPERPVSVLDSAPSLAGSVD